MCGPGTEARLTGAHGICTTWGTDPATSAEPGRVTGTMAEDMRGPARLVPGNTLEPHDELRTL